MFALNGFTCALALALLPALAFAQAAKPSTPHRIGVLAPRTDGPGNFDAFAGQLRDYGYVENQNIQFVWRSAEGREDRLEPLAAELAQEKVDVVVAFGPSASKAAARHASPTVPVVISTIDAVEQGLVSSLGRPGGNVTGVTFESDAASKQLEKFKDAIPGISRIGVVANPTMPGYANVMKSLESGAAKLGLRLVPVGVADPAALVPAFDEMKNARVDAFLLIPEPGVIDRLRDRIVALAAERRLPAMYSFRQYVEAGGLMSYGPNLRSSVARLAYFVHRILSGTKPRDIPVEQRPFELVLNLKTARALGITFPPAVRLSAESTIE